MIYRGYWGWKIFFSEIWVKGLTLSCGNGKSKGVWSGGGVTVGIPSVVGVWIFFGNTHLVIIPARKLFKFWTILQYHLQYYCQIPLQVILLPTQIILQYEGTFVFQ